MAITDLFNSTPIISSATGTADPLAALNNAGYTVDSFTYPLDLSLSSGESHFVIFYINESLNTQYPSPNSSGTFSSGGSPTPVAISGVTSSTPVSNSPQNLTTLSRQTKRISTAIAIYMPPNMQSSQSPLWESLQTGAAGNIAQNVMNGDYGKAISEVGLSWAKNLGKDTGNLLSRTLGLGDVDLNAGFSLGTRIATNPHLEMLFRSIDFRGFQFDFKFTPRTEKEALAVRNIVKAFTFYAAPEIKNASGFPKYFIYPAEFDIAFWSNGKENNFLKKISTCACTNATVSYTGAGEWSAFKPGALNGVPVETNLSLTFMELEIITKNRIAAGF